MSGAEIAFTIVAICTIFGILLNNTLTIVAVAKERKLQTKTNVFIVSLCVSDILVGIMYPFVNLIQDINMPMSLMLLKCGLSLFLIAYPMNTSVAHLTLIASERYIAVMHPLHYHLILTRRMVGLLIALAWVISGVVTSVIFYWPKPQWNGQACTLKFYPKSYIWFSGLVVATHIIVTLVLYARIFLVAWQQSKKVNTSETISGINCSAKRLSDIKAAKVLSLTVGVYLICWLPYLIYLALVMTKMVPRNLEVTSFLTLLPVANSALNFFVYAVMNKTFRQTFRKMCCSRCP